jgi:hypothetical protein
VESSELSAKVAELSNSKQELSLVELIAVGLSSKALKRTIVIEFGDVQSAFDAISPEGYFVDGEWLKQNQFDSRFI